MAKDNNPKIVGNTELMNQQPPRSGNKGASEDNMPGKMHGDKMPHEVFHNKMAKGLGC